MNKLYVLVGIPGVGKSTWVENQEWATDCVIVSTDTHVEKYAADQGKTYNEVFEDYMPTAVDLMAQDVIRARAAGKDIIWDQTSTTIKSRKRKFNMLHDYYKIAVVFREPDRDELYRRLKSRPGKVIPQSVVLQMKAHWEDPTVAEGFNEIWNA